MLNKNQIKTARKIAKAADQGGTIQADAAVRLFPGRPTLHTTMRIRDAWRAALGADVDLDDVAEALWG